MLHTVLRSVINVLLFCGLLSGCASNPLTPAELASVKSMYSTRLQDPRTSLRITVNSEPSGARIYGLSNGQPGTLLGTTPMTVKYTLASRSQSFSLWGQRTSEEPYELKCSLNLNAINSEGGHVIDYETDELIRAYETMSGPCGIFSVFGCKQVAQVEFGCVVVAQGHKPHIINQVIGSKTVNGIRSVDMEMLWKTLRGDSKTITAILEPKADFVVSSDSVSGSHAAVSPHVNTIKSRKEPPRPGKTSTQISVSQRWAVVVGLSKYKYSNQNGLADLIFADDDAKAFAYSLRNIGWNESHIKLLTNEKATKRNIGIALESWLSKAGPNDQIVLFWAGHGYPDPENSEKVYLATYDTEIFIPSTGFRMNQVRRILEEIKSKNVILFADTCHAGKLITRSGSSRGISIVPSINKMAREQKVPTGWIFMVGADTDRQSIEHTSWSNGAFTHSLIKGLSGEADGFQSAGAKDGIVTMGELKDYMKTSMPDETLKILGVAKHPVIMTSTGDPDIWNLTLQVTQ